MKGHTLLAFVLAFIAYCHVDALYTHKCKEAETSPDKFMRFIENANCTIIEGGKKVYETVNHLKLTAKHGINHFMNKFMPTTTKRPEFEGLDHPIDVRILSEDDLEPDLSRMKRETPEESNETGQGKK